jgi:predicted RNase H-like HicB family nuclease
MAREDCGSFTHHPEVTGTERWVMLIPHDVGRTHPATPCGRLRRATRWQRQSPETGSPRHEERNLGVSPYEEGRRAFGQAHTARRGVGMTTRYPIVFEVEETGAVSAYVPDLPVYAAADTAEEAERKVRSVLAHYLADRLARGLPLPGSRTVVKVARISSASGRRSTVTIVSPAALLGRQRSAKKAAASRRNGLRGGRPRGTSPGR